MNNRGSVNDTNGSFTHRPAGNLNRFGEENVRHDSYQDDQFKNDYDPTYEDEYGMKHPYEHGGRYNRWSDDIRSEASRENHAGKGPVGYKRSEDRIKEEACEILSRNWELDASDIEVNFKEGCIFLSGEVATRDDKRLAESLVENISGVNDVINQLKLKKLGNGWIPGLGSVSSDETNPGDQNE